MREYHPVLENILRKKFNYELVPRILKVISQTKEDYRLYEVTRQQLGSSTRSEMHFMGSSAKKKKVPDESDEEAQEEDEYDSGDSFLADEEDQSMNSEEFIEKKRKKKVRRELESGGLDPLEVPNVAGNKFIESPPIHILADVRPFNIRSSSTSSVRFHFCQKSSSLCPRQ